MAIVGLSILGRSRVGLLLIPLLSLLGMVVRFAMVMDHQGSQALQQCARRFAPNAVAAGKAARCVGTAAVAIWTRRTGELVRSASIGSR